MAIVEEVTRVRSRYKLLICGETLYVSAALLRARPLQPGDDIDLKEYEDWLLLHQYRPALDYAVSLLAQRPCASGEIRQKLERCGYRPQTVEMVLYKLSSNKLLDDTDFARQWASSRAGRSLGPKRIALELRRKGVSQEDTEAALEALPEEDSTQAALELARRSLRRAKDGEDPRKTAQRALQQLARRGYGYETAKKAVDHAMKESNGQEFDDDL